MINQPLVNDYKNILNIKEIENTGNLNYIGKKYCATIKNEIKLKGIGLHTGELIHLRILPAEAGTGIIYRSPYKSKGEIKNSPKSVISTNNAVSLSNGNFLIHTVEHLLTAFATAGITDAIVEIDNEEVPILDGSSKIFFEAIQDTGIYYFIDHKIEPIKILNPVWVISQDKYIIAVPSNEFKVTYTIYYEHPDLRGKSLHISLNSEIMKTEILSARTFGFLKDVEYLKSKGLIKGASLENAIALTENGYVNELRYPDECIRHKVLDLVGDLYLLNRPIIGHIIAYRSGHTLDVALAKNILEHLERNRFQYNKLKHKINN